MFKVWVLLFWQGGGYAGGPMIIDNIASQVECERVQKIINQTPNIYHTRCVEVIKVKQ